MPSPTPQAADTRQRLLEAAGEVFAEQGFRTATIQEICRRAGANIAAVHYHFGDKEQLYRAVIEYAQLCAPDTYPADIPPDAPAEVRLRAHIESFLVQLLDAGRPAWHGKLMAREMFEPTGALDAIVQDHIRQKQIRLSGIVRDLLGPGSSPDEERWCACSVTGQCLFYRHCQPVITRLFPGVPFGRAQVPELADHITRFSLAGIRAVAARGKAGVR